MHPKASTPIQTANDAPAQGGCAAGTGLYAIDEQAKNGFFEWALCRLCCTSKTSRLATATTWGTTGGTTNAGLGQQGGRGT